MLADELDYVLGVDAHRDEHVVAVVTAPADAVVAALLAAGIAGCDRVDRRAYAKANERIFNQLPRFPGA